MASIIAKSSRISWLSSCRICVRLSIRTIFRFSIALAGFIMKGSRDFHISHSGNNRYRLCRWNDASVQTMAAAMFLPRSQLHFFNHIGYSFERQMHCPWRSTDLGTCSCDITSATGKWMRVMWKCAGWWWCLLLQGGKRGVGGEGFAYAHDKCELTTTCNILRNQQTSTLIVVHSTSFDSSIRVSFIKWRNSPTNTKTAWA